MTMIAMIYIHYNSTRNLGIPKLGEANHHDYGCNTQAVKQTAKRSLRPTGGAALRALSAALAERVMADA